MDKILEDLKKARDALMQPRPIEPYRCPHGVVLNPYVACIDKICRELFWKSDEK